MQTIILHAWQVCILLHFDSFNTCFLGMSKVQDVLVEGQMEEENMVEARAEARSDENRLQDDHNAEELGKVLDID